MFVNQFKTYCKNNNLRIFNTYVPGENLNYFKKGMVSIYCGYIWKKKPIIVKGSLNRVRDITFIDDVINILADTIKNKKLKKNEVINLSSGESFTVKKLLKEIIFASGNKKYKIIVTSGNRRLKIVSYI